MIKLLVPFVGPVLVEVITQGAYAVVLENNINSSQKIYELAYGSNMEDWTDKIKIKHLTECRDLRANHPYGGLITHTINKNHDLNMRKETYEGMVEIFWGKKGK